MNRKIKVISIVFCLSVFLMLVSCRVPKEEWKGTIEEVDGVTVITNPDEPLYGELVLDLEEDLSIGREDDDRYLFFRIIDIKVDRDGNIYIFEGGKIEFKNLTAMGTFSAR